MVKWILNKLGMRAFDYNAHRPSRWMGGGSAPAGVKVNPQTMMTVSAIFAAVRNISEDVAKLPLIVYRRQANGGKQRAAEHAAYYLLHDEPNPEMTAITLRSAITANALLWGNGYAEVQWAGNGKPLAVWPIPPWLVEPRRTRDGRRYYHAMGRDVLADSMLHVPGFTQDGVLGAMIHRYAEESVGLAIAAQRFACSFFGNGGVPGYVLQHPAHLSEEAIGNLKSTWQGRFGGPDNAYKPEILEEGMTLKEVGIDPQKAQGVESREFSVEDVCRWFRIPPHKVGHLKRAQGWSTLEATNTDYVVDTLMPWLVRWEQEINRKVLGDAFFAEHLLSGLLRGDSAARGEFYAKLFGIGAISINEIRAAENLNPIGAEGDVHYVPLNMTPAKRKDQAAQPFLREVVKSLLTDKVTNDVIYNVSDIPALLEGAGVPLDKTVNLVKGEGLPYLPVVGDNRQLVSGATIQDPDGTLVGGDTENSEPASDDTREEELPQKPPEPSQTEEQST